MSRATLYIDLKHYQRNLASVKAKYPHAKIMAVIKANGYGLGAIPLAKAALEVGVTWFAVAHMAEGIALRNAGITDRIVLLSQPINESLVDLWDFNLTPTVYQSDMILNLNHIGQQRQKKIAVHLEVDTGMGRLGCFEDEVLSLAQLIWKSPFLEFEGVFTHFASADTPQSDFTHTQFIKFCTVLDHLKTAGLSPPIRHAANSGGVQFFEKTVLDMVRVGIMSYENCVTLSAPIVSLKTFKAGQSIGYGQAHTVSQDTTIAVLPIGYEEGIPRRYGLSGGHVLIQGQRYPIVGRVCMDLLMVDVGLNPPNMSLGTLATLIGTQENKTITVKECAENLGVSEYEILCGLGDRLARVYG